MSNRLEKINDEIFREASIIIRSELNDPRIGTMTSVVRTETTKDLEQCKIYVSVFGDEQQKKEVFEGLKNASGYIRKLLATRINLRHTPELKFLLDDSLDYSDKINKLIKSVKTPKEETPEEESAEEKDNE